jgi:Xaa-Pro aminopeptidase
MDFKAGRKRFATDMATKGIENILIQNQDSIYYLSGFYSAVATRPFGLLLTPYKEVLITPMTAVDSAREEAPDMTVVAYCEHPAGAGVNLSFHAALKEALTSGVSGKIIGVEAARMSVTDETALNGLGMAEPPYLRFDSDEQDAVFRRVSR